MSVGEGIVLNMPQNLFLTHLRKCLETRCLGASEVCEITEWPHT